MDETISRLPPTAPDAEAVETLATPVAFATASAATSAATTRAAAGVIGEPGANR